MKLVVNPPTPWPNLQAPTSTRRNWPTAMERAVEGKRANGQKELLVVVMMNFTFLRSCSSRPGVRFGGKVPPGGTRGRHKTRPRRAR